MPFLRKTYQLLLESVEIIVIAGGIFVVIYAFIFRPNEVSGSSMFPTFVDKQQIITSILDAKLDRLTRGDVIVFHPPVPTDELYIKRIIALPGETIKLQNGAVYINGQRLDESAYLQSSVITSGESFLQDGVEKTVPPDSFFVMGDNREFSSDSREWGFLEKNKIIGKSIIRFWPLYTFEFITNPYH